MHHRRFYRNSIEFTVESQMAYNFIKTLQDYITKMVQSVHGMKVLLLDKETVTDSLLRCLDSHVVFFVNRRCSTFLRSLR
jgi:hypothetical protein